MELLINIYYVNSDEERRPDDEEMLNRIFLCAVEEIGFDVSSEIDVTFCDNSYIRQINKEHRNIDEPTEVLSFPMTDMDNGRINSIEGDIDIGEDKLLLGDIIISFEMAKKQSKEYGHSLKRESSFLALHGFLHILGFDHEDEKTKEAMFSKQNIILTKCNYIR